MSNLHFFKTHFFGSPLVIGGNQRTAPTCHKRCISFTGFLCASLFSNNKLKLGITWFTECLLVTCVLPLQFMTSRLQTAYPLKSYSFMTSIHVTILRSCNSIKRSIPVFLSITSLAIALCGFKHSNSWRFIFAMTKIKFCIWRWPKTIRISLRSQI